MWTSLQSHSILKFIICNKKCNFLWCTLGKLLVSWGPLLTKQFVTSVGSPSVSHLETESCLWPGASDNRNQQYLISTRSRSTSKGANSFTYYHISVTNCQTIITYANMSLSNPLAVKVTYNHVSFSQTISQKLCGFFINKQLYLK